ncbi:MAG TPA: hypothetical protein VNQ31_08895 [Sphingomonadaceae bacterium]|nr:hypothetical protein [Sphingomonadaceae bacterium]
MALTALIAACQTEAESDRLRATLPLLGQTLIEYQARLAIRAGASAVLVLAEHFPAALAAAIDRLRRDGLNVEVARTLAVAVGRVHPDDGLLVIADGFVGSGRFMARVIEARDQALLTVPDDADHARFERIDARARWGGLLLIDGRRLREVAAMLGDWDLESTLLRRAVQAGVPRIAADESGPDGPIGLADHPDDLEALEARLFAGSRGEGGERDWPARYLYPAIERVGVPPLLVRGVEADWLGIGAVAAAWIAAVALALTEWRWLALPLLLLSGPLAALGRRLAATRLIEPRHAGLFGPLRVAGGVATLLVLVSHMQAGAGWGVWPLAGLLLIAMVAIRAERRVLGRLPGGTVQPWLASLDGLVLLLLPFAVAGYWLAGLVVLAAYAAVSLFAAQREVAARLAAAPREQD